MPEFEGITRQPKPFTIRGTTDDENDTLLSLENNAGTEVFSVTKSGVVNSSGGPVFDIRSYQALESNTENNDEIQAAADAARLAGGGTIFIPEGTWKHTADLILGPNTTLMGAGPGSILKRTSTTDTVSSIKNYDRTFGGTDSDISIQNLTIWRDGEAATPNAAYDNAVFMRGVTRFGMRNVHVIGAAKGVHLEGCLYPIVSDSWFDGFVDNGLALTWNGSTFVCYGNLSNLNFGAPSASGYSLGGSSLILTAGGVTASNLMFKDCASNCIELGNGAAYVHLSNIVAKYSGSGTVTNSILAMNVTDLTIDGADIERGSVQVNVNTPASEWNDRIYFRNIRCRTGSVALKHVRDGHIINCSGSLTANGVQVLSCADVTVLDSEAHDNTASGFYFATNGAGAANTRIVVKNNRSYDNGTAGTVGGTYGFSVDGGNKIELWGNRAYDSAGASGTQTHGLYINATTLYVDNLNDFEGNKTGERANFTGSPTQTKILPGTQIDYVQFEASTPITATTEATANTVVAASAFTYDGSTPILIEFFANGMQRGTSYIFLDLYDGASSIGFLAFQDQPGRNGPVYAFRRLTPSAASHTYSVRAHVDAGTGSVDAGLGGVGVNVPGFIRVTRA